MKTIDLSGKVHTIDLKKYIISPDDIRPRSSLHLQCRALLKTLYPLDIICEEVYLPGQSLFLDFLIPIRKIAIEVNGIEHSQYVPFFHNNDKMNFYKAQNRDKTKIAWCSTNNIRLVTLNYDESESEWKRAILG